MQCSSRHNDFPLAFASPLKRDTQKNLHIHLMMIYFLKVYMFFFSQTSTILFFSLLSSLLQDSTNSNELITATTTANVLHLI